MCAALRRRRRPERKNRQRAGGFVKAGCSSQRLPTACGVG